MTDRDGVRLEPGDPVFVWVPDGDDWLPAFPATVLVLVADKDGAIGYRVQLDPESSILNFLSEETERFHPDDYDDPEGAREALIALLDRRREVLAQIVATRDLQEPFVCYGDILSLNPYA